RTEIKSDKDAERLVTLASVIRPRFQPGSASAFGSAPPSTGSGVPGVTTGGGPHSSDGSGVTPPAYGNGGSVGTDESGSDPAWGSGDNGASTGTGWNYQSRRVGQAPKLGQRLNQRP